MKTLLFATAALLTVAAAFPDWPRPVASKAPLLADWRSHGGPWRCGCGGWLRGWRIQVPQPLCRSNRQRQSTQQQRSEPARKS